MQALVQLLMPVLKQRDDLLGARLVGAVRRYRVAPVVPPSPADEPDERQCRGDQLRIY